MRSKVSKTDYSDRPAYTVDHDIIVSYEYEFNEKTTFVPNDELRIKRAHGKFKFIKHTYSPNRDAEWIDVKDYLGKIRSFYTNDIKGPVPKKRRKKPVKNG